MSLPTFVDDGTTLILDYKGYDPEKQNRYWSCPVQFVPDNVWGFLKMYNVIKTFPNIPIPAYDDLHPKFLDALYYYEARYNEYLTIAVESK